MENQSGVSFEDKLKQASLWAFWLKRDRIQPLEPWLWKWDNIHSSLIEAGNIVRLEEASRRTIQLVHPTIGGLKGTSRTIQASFQLVKPGEVAEAHRHTASALRFVVQGRGAYTTVEGEKMTMEPGDLILTPGWCWHDHSNETNEPIIWMDGIDVHIMLYLNSMFQEEYPSKSQPITKREGYSGAVLGRLRPKMNTSNKIAPFSFKWTDTLKALEDMSTEEADPYDGVYLEYKNPLQECSTMTTIGCYVQLLKPGQKTAPHRHTTTTIYNVVSGEGVTETQGKDLRWSSKDCFLVPSWSVHRHVNLSSTSPAFLFSMTDRPLMEQLGVYREDSGPDFNLPKAYTFQPAVNTGQPISSSRISPDLSTSTKVMTEL
jgi:gentisate 1,2-dioxygenase